MALVEVGDNLPCQSTFVTSAAVQSAHAILSPSRAHFPSPCGVLLVAGVRYAVG